MRNIAVFLVFAACTLRPAFAQNPAVGQTGATGTWAANDVAFAPWTFQLQANGVKLTGTVSQGPADPGSGLVTSLTGATPIYDGAIEGNSISFKVASPGGGTGP